MKKFLASVVTLAACGLPLMAEAQGSSVQNSKVTLPSEVKELIERIALCEHLGGEYDAPGSPRTLEVAEAVEVNRCSSVDQELKNMKHKYADNRAVARALAKARSERPE